MADDDLDHIDEQADQAAILAGKLEQEESKESDIKSTNDTKAQHNQNNSQ